MVGKEVRKQGPKAVSRGKIHELQNWRRQRKKIDKPYASLTKKKEKVQIKSEMEISEVTMNATEIRRIIRDYCE